MSCVPGTEKVGSLTSSSMGDRRSAVEDIDSRSVHSSSWSWSLVIVVLMAGSMSLSAGERLLGIE